MDQTNNSDRTSNLLKSIKDLPFPPVEEWNPDYCGEMDLSIKSDGSWWLEGTPFARVKMQKLFARIIKKENDKFFLVTPVEKLGIQIEWQPFVMTDFEVIKRDDTNCFSFKDNLDNQVVITDPDQIKLSSFQGQLLPIIHVRRNLYASLHRNCYYHLLDAAEIVSEQDKLTVYIQSNNHKICIGHSVVD
ncbi:MAG: DUF1285 domain-containing protein [Gammaproteobacteria bacterium]|nr:DUF1285 domain-containing protein [Gammaproteobacteria bacterium]MDH5630156.1 DUF1285 domain-containing protein [Gammaproteobacteria bacterium]